jgi:putative chitinase
MSKIDQDTLENLWPHGNDKVPGLTEGMISAVDAGVFEKYGLTNSLLVAHAMAQFSHECGAGMEMVENLNYSAQGLVKTWPTRFNSASAMSYAHNPQKIANKVYNGRMGNEDDSDDGWSYRGRGLSQLTGRENYQALSHTSGIDLLDNPDAVNNPATALECGVADFIMCGCLPYAKQDDVRGVTHHLNGGYIGLDERTRWLDRWKLALDVKADEPDDDGTLAYGSKGFEVTGLQNRLVELGYPVGAADGDFGATTRKALLGFQADNNLPQTGVLDDATKAAMQTAPNAPIGEGRATATAADLRDLGSTTVLSADKIKTAGKLATGTGIIVGADQSGMMDKAKDLTGHVSEFRSMMDGLQNAVHWVGGHLWVLAPIIGIVIWYFGRNVIKSRLQDHRDGSNLGR